MGNGVKSDKIGELNKTTTQQHNKQQQIRRIKVTTAEVVSEKENFFSDRRRSFSSFILLSFVLSVFSRFSRLKVIC